MTCNVTLISLDGQIINDLWEYPGQTYPMVIIEKAGSPNRNFHLVDEINTLGRKHLFYKEKEEEPTKGS